MAMLKGWTLFPRPKPKNISTSAFVRSRVNKLYKDNTEPSDALRDDFRDYLEIKARARREA